MGKLCLRTIVMLLAGIMLAGCATITEAVSNLFKPKEGSIEETLAATYVDGPRVRVGVVLVVQVSTLADKPTTMQVQVDQNGTIILPYLLQEPVPCDGMKLDELKDKLLKEYSYYLKQPQIMVTFAPFDAKSGGVSPWGTVTVLGEVSSPGPVNMPSTKDMTVTKVLQASGGLRPFADKRNVRVTRCDRTGKQTRFTVNLDEIGKEGRIDKDITLCAGDVVFVPETWY